MRVSYSAAQAAPEERKRFWDEVISRTYFPLELQFHDTPSFSGSVDAWSLGAVSLSRNVSDGMVYRRHERHLLHEREEHYLITIPERSEICFTQDGKDVRCRPGAFLVERSHLPYEFSYADPNALWVLKVPAATLRARIGHPERLATLSFDATRGIGALFVDMVRLAAPRLDEMDEAARGLTGRHMVELLAMSVEADDRVLASGASPVQSAHLHRVERFIRAHLARSDLTPQTIAEGCGISVRYLHQLFENQGATVSEWVRRQRLMMCDEALSDPNCRQSISDLAYQWGFSDQAQFSRHYKAFFGRTPSETRALARARLVAAASEP
ncbi:AraC-like DNA-binding protein [Tepidamorphus gemmatus]|uniref:AraC-like DNA-binding protein n=1 Tax=Tepidamorphus gemmatus TaxID=747076 RepID=A0A4R3MAC7_9HYPH|nr:helix-turn-helix domain-containing protein [Tepidamorphus gemmatus]TCT10551.1 AraC-like DNA-binding protein [Tepidamorphus gemmatus]